MPAPAIATAPRTTTPVRTLDAEQIKLLVEQGEKYIAAGDVVAFTNMVTAIEINLRAIARKQLDRLTTPQ